MPSFYVYRRGKTAKVFTAQIKFAGGARYLRSTGETDKRKAEAVARRLMAEIAEKELPRRGVEILTVETMFSRWIVEHGQSLRSGKDIKWQVEKILKLIGGAREVRDLSNKDINGFVQDAKAEGAGAVSVNRCLETLRSVMNYAAMRWEEPVKVIAWKTFRLKEAKAREVYLSPEEARRLMAILPEHIALAFAFTLYTGMRLNELETLRWEQIDLERGLAVVETKGGGTRPVWLSGKALAILQILREELPPMNERVVGKDFIVNGAKWKVFELVNRRKHWEAARNEIGRPDVHWHDLRAMTATWARQHSGQKDLSLIGKALGHSGTQVTERYARVVDREIVQMLDQLPDISAASIPEKKRITLAITGLDQKAPNS